MIFANGHIPLTFVYSSGPVWGGGTRLWGRTSRDNGSEDFGNKKYHETIQLDIKSDLMFREGARGMFFRINILVILTRNNTSVDLPRNANERYC